MKYQYLKSKHILKLSGKLCSRTHDGKFVFSSVLPSSFLPSLISAVHTSCLPLAQLWLGKNGGRMHQNSEPTSKHEIVRVWSRRHNCRWLDWGCTTSGYCNERSFPQKWLQNRRKLSQQIPWNGEERRNSEYLERTAQVKRVKQQFI